MTDIPTHHFIYGTTTDFLTGETIVDTDDERFRQQLARFFVEEKHYLKTDLLPRRTIETLFANTFVVSTIELLATIARKRFFIVRYGPGSIVTRERPALAAARVLEPDYIIPYTIVTNGIDAEVLDSKTGKVVERGLAAIPNKDEALALLKNAAFLPLPAGQREMELRILNAYDKEVCCVGGPCALPSAPEG